METRMLILILSGSWFLLSIVIAVSMVMIENKTKKPVITEDGIAGNKMFAVIIILAMLPVLLITAFVEYARKEVNEYEVYDELPTIYLCGPMENVSREEGTTWRNDVKKLFKDMCTIYDPYDIEAETNTYTKGDKILQAKEIVTKDLECINKSDILLVNLNGQGCGTYYEVMYAYLHGKKIIGFGHTENPWNLCHIEIYPDFMDACYAVKKCINESTSI